MRQIDSTTWVLVAEWWIAQAAVECWGWMRNIDIWWRITAEEDYFFISRPLPHWGRTQPSPLNLLYENCPVLFDYILPPQVHQTSLKHPLSIIRAEEAPCWTCWCDQHFFGYFLLCDLTYLESDCFWNVLDLLSSGNTRTRATSKSPAFYRPIDAFYCQYTLRIIQKWQEIIS